MPFLSHPRCPRCRQEVSLVDLWWNSKKNFLVYFPPSVAIHCTNCGVALLPDQRAAYCVPPAFFLAAYVVGKVVKPMEPYRDYIGFGFILMIGVIVAVSWQLFPRIATLREASAQDVLKFPLEEVTASRSISETTHAAVAKQWICRGCKESNPMDFDLCWKCNKPAQGHGI